MAVEARDLDRDLAGLDALEAHGVETKSRWVRTWSALWPKLAAILLVLAFWQIVVWSHWREPYVLPPLQLLELPPAVAARTPNVVEDLKLNAEILRTTLQEFGIDVKVENVTKGPVVTLTYSSPMRERPEKTATWVSHLLVETPAGTSHPPGGEHTSGAGMAGGVHTDPSG